MWAFHAPVDAERGIVYIPIGSPATNYYGGDRPGNNAYGNSIVAVDAQTGKYLWHFQTVHHDIWDTDMPTAGALFDFVLNGKRTPAIAHVGKSSYVYVLDRDDGQAAHRRRRRLRCRRATCRPSGIRRRSRFRCVRAPLSRVSFKPETDLVRPEDTTPEHVAACVAMMEKGRRLLQRRAVHAVHVQGARCAAEVDDSVAGRNGRRELGRDVDGSGQRRVLRQRAEHDAGRLDAAAAAGAYRIRRPGSHAGWTSPASRRDRITPYDRGSVPANPDGHCARPVLHVLGAAQRQDARPGAPCVRPPWSKLYAVNANTGQIVWESRSV